MRGNSKDSIKLYSKRGNFVKCKNEQSTTFREVVTMVGAEGSPNNRFRRNSQHSSAHEEALAEKNEIGLQIDTSKISPVEAKDCRMNVTEPYFGNKIQHPKQLHGKSKEDFYPLLDWKKINKDYERVRTKTFDKDFIKENKREREKERAASAFARKRLRKIHSVVSKQVSVTSNEDILSKVTLINKKLNRNARKICSEAETTHDKTGITLDETAFSKTGENRLNKTVPQIATVDENKKTRSDPNKVCVVGEDSGLGKNLDSLIQKNFNLENFVNEKPLSKEMCKGIKKLKKLLPKTEQAIRYLNEQRKYRKALESENSSSKQDPNRAQQEQNETSKLQPEEVAGARDQFIKDTAPIDFYKVRAKDQYISDNKISGKELKIEHGEFFEKIEKDYWISELNIDPDEEQENLRKTLGSGWRKKKPKMKKYRSKSLATGSKNIELKIDECNKERKIEIISEKGEKTSVLLTGSNVQSPTKKKHFSRASINPCSSPSRNFYLQVLENVRKKEELNEK